MKPLKRGGGRRYYRPEDIALLRRIRELLYTEGYTIRGVQRLFREVGVKAIVEGVTEPAEDTARAPAAEDAGLSRETRAELEAVLSELMDLRRLVRPE